MENSKKLLIIITLLAISLLSVNLSAQHANKKSWEQKLKKMIGDPEEIIIKTTEGKYIFDKEEATALIKQLKMKKHKLNFVVDSDKDIKHNVIVKELADSDDDNVFVLKKDFDNFDWEGLIDDIDIDKKIKVKVDDGEKVIEVITEDGDNKNVEVYTGKDADKFLEEHSSGKKLDKLIKIKVDSTLKDKDLVWVTEDIDDEDGVEKKEVEVKLDGDKKQVTITTTKDGKEETKVLTGEEADEYLKKHSGGAKKIFIHTDKDGKDSDCKIIKIKKLNDNDDEIEVEVNVSGDKKIKKKVIIKEEEEEEKK